MVSKYHNCDGLPAAWKLQAIDNFSHPENIFYKF